MKKSPLWFLLNPYGWLIVMMSIITAFILGEWWILLLGVIGYQTVLFVELTWGGNLGRSGRVRLARAEQENRELRAEQARLLGAIRERDEKLAAQGVVPPPILEPESPTQEAK
ncbi:MAG: hypothetical protein Fur0022_14990 [Anaerolineales bacterium]